METTALNKLNAEQEETIEKETEAEDNDVDMVYKFLIMCTKA
jgi:hypothetical protein